MENEKETIDLNEGDFIEICVSTGEMFFCRVVKKYITFSDECFIIAVCNYNATDIYYKVLNYEGHGFTIKSSLSFYENIKSEYIFVTVRKIEDSESSKIVEKILKKSNRRIYDQIKIENEIKILFK